ncbi:hypothetical protein LEN26_009884 [Aphanomyces euteiches]|nr:hypothetical protein LEN26_009884 [Aphanomyces euteiches]KAH9186773.1 hypothetical protein AeNC1_011245 [Aphanomyces euteiches]
MSKLKCRAPSMPNVLSSPLPLYKLPIETKTAKTGCAERLAELPVVRHILTSPQEPEMVLEPEPIASTAVPDADDEDEDDDDDDDAVLRTPVFNYYDRTTATSHTESTATLVFDSIFESGNLLRADRVRYPDHPTQFESYHDYELWLHPDLNNSAYRQWFYLSVTNGEPGVVYRFHIVNLAKSAALFKVGLQPVVYSELDAADHNIGWVHRGSHITYEASPQQEGSNTLSFTYSFSRAGDRVFFACIQPYTYTDLQEYLDALGNDPERSAVCRRTELCQTLAGNTCDLLTITSPGKEGKPMDARRVIVVSARVHPGESNSSFMMKGMIDYLTSKASGAVVLRHHFIFKITPMLNPDGVINGNTRVNLAGWDLNRKWDYPVEKLFPTIFHLKRLITTYQRPQPNGTPPRVAVYCDLHGHSIQRNIFTYGCYKPVRKAAGKSIKLSAKDDPRVFPMIVAKHSDMFSFAHCNFKVQPSKRNTARVVVHQELGVIHSYTLEASFCGPDFGAKKNTQFSIADLEHMGVHWCRSLLLYFDLTAEVAHEETKDAMTDVPTSSAAPAEVNQQQQEAHGGEWDPGILCDCETELCGMMDELLKEEGCCNDDCDSDVSEAANDAIAPNNASPELCTPPPRRLKKTKTKKKLKRRKSKKAKKKKASKDTSATARRPELVLKSTRASLGAIVVPDSTPLAGLLVGKPRFELDLNIDVPTNVYLHLKRPSSSSSIPSTSPIFPSEHADLNELGRLVRPTSG